MQAATEFYFLAGSMSQIQVRIPQLIRWNVPPNPYIKLNTDGSAIGNLELANAGGKIVRLLGWVDIWFLS